MGDSVTLDTNVLLEYWKDQAKIAVVEELLRLGAAGELVLTVTSRIRQDIPRAPLADRINELPELNVVETGSITRLGYWELGRDRLGSDDFAEATSQIEEDMKRRGTVPPDWRDWDHLHAHFATGHDVFLTWDKRVLEAGSELNRRFRIVVMTPDTYLQSRRGSSEVM